MIALFRGDPVRAWKVPNINTVGESMFLPIDRPFDSYSPIDILDDGE